jgi:steroid delta-isomerase-like uncharacterized protein
MRKVSFVLAGVIGFVFAVSACGGGEENQPPKTPAAPVAQTPATPTPTVETPKEEAKPKETLGQLQEKTGRGMMAAMNARDSKKLASFYSEGAVVKIAGAPADASGREAIAQSWQKLFEAFPDYKSNASRIWVKNDVVVVEWVFNGTHSGDLWGIKGTEKKVGLTGVDVMWFTPEGQVKEHHVYYDGGTILSQIGVSPQKARPIPAIPTEPQVFATPGPDEGKNTDMARTMMTSMDNKKEADFLAPLADTVEYDDMTQPQTSKGKAEAKKFFKEMTTAFPDTKSTLVNVFAVGDYVIKETQWTGTHKATFFGMAPTKKTVNVKGLEIEQFKDGKMVKGWSYSNGADFMQQLGKMPGPGAGKPAAAAKPTDTKPATPAAAKPADTKPTDTKPTPAAAPKK